MSINRVQGSQRPLDVERGMIGRVLNRGMGVAAGGAVAGGVAGATVLGVGALVGITAGSVIGAVAGVASGMSSADPQKLQNRPLKVLNMLGETQTVYVSAEQWRSMQAASKKGVIFDNLPAPLNQQLNSPPAAPVKP